MGGEAAHPLSFLSDRYHKKGHLDGPSQAVRIKAAVRLHVTRCNTQSKAPGGRTRATLRLEKLANQKIQAETRSVVRRTTLHHYTPKLRWYLLLAYHIPTPLTIPHQQPTPDPTQTHYTQVARDPNALRHSQAPAGCPKALLIALWSSLRVRCWAAKPHTRCPSGIDRHSFFHRFNSQPAWSYVRRSRPFLRSTGPPRGRRPSSGSNISVNFTMKTECGAFAPPRDVSR